MKSIKLLVIILHFTLTFSFCGKAQNTSQETVIEIINPSQNWINQLAAIEFRKTDALYPTENLQLVALNKNNALQYKFKTDKPGTVRLANEWVFLVEPGDHVRLIRRDNEIKVEGIGAEKYRLTIELKNKRKNVKTPSNPKDHLTLSETDFFEWHEYIKELIKQSEAIIDTYKGKITSFAFHYLKSKRLGQDLDDYSDKFAGIRYYKGLGIDRMRAIELYDTKYKILTDAYFPYVAQHTVGTWKPVMWSVDRKHGFLSVEEGSNLAVERRIEYLEDGKKVFKGDAKEKFIYDVLYNRTIKIFGFSPQIEKALDQYLSEPGYPKWKAYMKEQVLKLRERGNLKSAPDFELTDEKGKIITKQNFKGKLVILDYWFTGCVGCIQMVPQMRKLENEFKSDSNVVFVNVCVDSSKDKWLKSVAQGKYTSGSGLNVYTGGQGDKHSMIKYYGISGYPSLVILDAYGRTINVFPKLDPRGKAGYERVSEFIKKQLLEMKDGPYLISENDHVTSYSFNGVKMKTEIKEKALLNDIKVNTHQPGTPLIVQLKNNLMNEPDIFTRPEKLVIFSDIEGNFGALVKLLMTNKVIDQSYNWTLGKGHLVFAGDMFDRGNQVTECLWLMYALEDKAKAAGGYVHFVLGNHEIMNLQGDVRYNQPKYLANAQKAGKQMKELYGANSELGRWLRTKNIIERIGNLLFVHGGVGLNFASAVQLPIEKINQLARPNYGNSELEKSNDQNLKMIFDSQGPLWYRFYYETNDKKTYLNTKDSTEFTIYKPTQNQIDSILNKFGAKHIITGHTIVADTISTHYDNCVINTDVPHAKGKSEALLIEGNTFYRVNDKGERKLLFRDQEEDIKTKK